jgi:hypothetical protein
VPKEDDMARGRSRTAPGAVTKTLDLIATALETLHQETGLRAGEADALRAFGELAAFQIPTRGLFASGENELDVAIDRIAKRHLGFKTARKAFFDATATVEPFALRDHIETAANDLRCVSDNAQFYAGLAFGVTLVEFGSIDFRRNAGRR